jgi:hypothetical protein
VTAVPPFRLLDPALRTAETLLSQGVFAAVVNALPDERQAARELEGTLRGLRLFQQNGLWRAEFDEELNTAAAGLVALVVTDGWRRLKRCEVCAAAFVDRTNGCSRRRCREHVRNGSA